jgi:predicted deacylase
MEPLRRKSRLPDQVRVDQVESADPTELEKGDDEAWTICGTSLLPGERQEIALKVSESYLAASIRIPMTVVRGKRPGPVAFVMAAIHGDEINGVDIVRRLIFDIDLDSLKGTLIAIPVVNIPGFLVQSRYLPYHRDLNRFFPGKRKGNNAQRFAHALFKEVVSKCDFGIDLHTAAHGRWNLPHVRGDLSHPSVKKLARAFGSEVVVDDVGVKGSLRRAATDAGVPTILFEAGETGRFSQKVSVAGLRGVLCVLRAMGMWEPPTGSKGLKRPPFQVIVRASEWSRAQRGGILDLAVGPGDLVYKDQVIGAILNPYGRTVTKITAPATGIIIGVTTAPLTIPGSGIVHLARLKKTLSRVERSIQLKKARRQQRLKQKSARRRSEG